MMLDFSHPPIFPWNFRFDRTPAILICKGGRNLGRVPKLMKGPLSRRRVGDEGREK